MQKLSFDIKDLDFVYLLWVFAYKFRFEKEGIGQKPILNKQRVLDDNCDKHYLHLETLNSLLGSVHDVVMGLMFTERIGVQPFTVSAGEDRGKKEWFASYEHDSTNSNQPVQKLADIYQDGSTPAIAVLKCFLAKQLGNQVIITIDEKGNYIHVEST